VRPELRRIGKEQNPVVVVDEFSGHVADIVAIADALTPFPDVDSGYYPGIRRMLSPSDEAAATYVNSVCQLAAPFIGGAFGAQGFVLVEASFSIVTSARETLLPQQRAPHFDSPDPNYLAVLHYLSVPPGTGTAFYRHRSTGVERVTDANLDLFVAAAKSDAARLPPDASYIQGSDEFYERIAAIEAVPDRLLIYQGSLLHSGMVPPQMKLTADPREGRLTANIFVRAKR
jgi:hypothetical protein